MTNGRALMHVIYIHIYKITHAHLNLILIDFLTFDLSFQVIKLCKLNINVGQRGGSVSMYLSENI